MTRPITVTSQSSLREEGKYGDTIGTPYSTEVIGPLIMMIRIAALQLFGIKMW